MYVTHPVPPDLRLMADHPAPSPCAAALKRVEAIWEREKAGRPGLFDGTLFSIARFEGDTALGFMARYKWYVAQLAEPALYDELRVSSLAVSGLVIAGGHVIFGKRKLSLAVEGGLWESAPTGTISAEGMGPDGSLDWRKTFVEEMREELGLDVSPEMARAFALVENTHTHIFELGVAAVLGVDHREVLAAYACAPHPEHTEMGAVPVADVPRFYTARTQEMVGACGFLLAAYGLIETP